MIAAAPRRKAKASAFIRAVALRKQLRDAVLALLDQHLDRISPVRQAASIRPAHWSGT